MAALATGALLGPVIEGGVTKLVSNGIEVRATCGATLISPSYVVKAAHCTDTSLLDVPVGVEELPGAPGLGSRDGRRVGLLGRGLFSPTTRKTLVLGLFKRIRYRVATQPGPGHGWTSREVRLNFGGCILLEVF